MGTTMKLASGFCALLVMMVIPVTAQEVDQIAFAKSTKLFDQGVKAEKNNKMDEAEALFKQALEVNPLLPGAYVELGHIHGSNPQEALDYYLKAKETYIQIHDLKAKNMAKQQSAQQDFIQAGQDSQMLQSRKQTSARIEQTTQQRVQESRDKQQAENRQVVPEVREAEIPAQLFLFIGAARLRLGQSDLAEQDFQSGLKKDSKNALLHYNMGVVHFIKGRYPQAADEVRQAKKLGFVPPEDFVKQLETKGQLKL